jgi:hypothetical protein
MSVRVSSMFMFSCVGSGHATGLITRPKSPSTLYKIHSSRLIQMGNRPRRLMRKAEEDDTTFCIVEREFISSGIFPFDDNSE